MLLNSRRHPYLICADIEKAFLMVGINEADRDCLRFLWLKDPACAPTRDNVEIFRFRRVPFGVVCSPYLLQAAIEKLLKESDFPIASELKHAKYMDNLYYGSSSVEEALKKYKEIKKLFVKVGMNIREFL